MNAIQRITNEHKQIRNFQPLESPTKQGNPIFSSCMNSSYSVTGTLT